MPKEKQSNKPNAIREPIPLTPDQRERKIHEFLTRGVSAIYPSPDDLEARLRSGERLTAYIGIDPTAPEIHVGHASQLMKARRLQELGHHVVLLVGDFTATIGDPTDKAAARTKLTREQVLANAHLYRQQAASILDFDNKRNPVELRYNSEWLAPMTFDRVLDLASEMTVQQMSQRDMFQRRFASSKPVFLSEFLYPLMQGWDSVALGVDLEIGGNDQIFNMLVGSDFVKRHLGKQKFVVAGDLLVDPSGKKIGKSEGNMVTLVDSPEEMYQKVMRWGDAIVPHALELCTDMPMDQVRQIDAQMGMGQLDGLSAKKLLARTMVAQYHSSELATRAEAAYERVSQGQATDNVEEAHFVAGTNIVDLLVASGFAKSKSEARRLLSQGGVRMNGETITDQSLIPPSTPDGYILQVGKRRQGSFRKVLIDEQ